MKKLWILSILLLFISCGCPKIVTDKHVITDSVTVEKVRTKRDTVLITPKASVSLNLPLNAFKKPFKQPLIKQTKQAKIKIEYKRDTIELTAECDTVALSASLFDTQIKEKRNKQTLVREVVEKKYIPWWVKTLAWIGAINLLLLLGGALIKFNILKIPF